MWCCILASLLAAADAVSGDLAPPVLLQAGGRPINVDMGHAAPFLADLKGDGHTVLLVGRRSCPGCRSHKNAGKTRHSGSSPGPLTGVNSFVGFP
jgi:hypothetical protein